MAKGQNRTYKSKIIPPNPDIIKTTPIHESPLLSHVLHTVKYSPQYPNSPALFRSFHSLTHLHISTIFLSRWTEKVIDMDEDSAPASPPSLKTKLKNSLCFSCCFRRLPNHHHHHRQVPDSPSALPPSDEKPTLLWLKAKVPHDLKDDIKDKCFTILGRIGNGSARHKRHGSAEFRYDPLSYALNFEDGFDDDDEYPLRNFSARLPPSQPVQAVPLREISAI